MCGIQREDYGECVCEDRETQREINVCVCGIGCM